MSDDTLLEMWFDFLSMFQGIYYHIGEFNTKLCTVNRSSKIFEEDTRDINTDINGRI